jgi:hypothetical protein
VGVTIAYSFYNSPKYVSSGSARPQSDGNYTIAVAICEFQKEKNLAVQGDLVSQVPLKDEKSGKRRYFLSVDAPDNVGVWHLSTHVFFMQTGDVEWRMSEDWAKNFDVQVDLRVQQGSETIVYDDLLLDSYSRKIGDKPTYADIERLGFDRLDDQVIITLQFSSSDFQGTVGAFLLLFDTKGTGKSIDFQIVIRWPINETSATLVGSDGKLLRQLSIRSTDSARSLKVTGLSLKDLGGKPAFHVVAASARLLEERMYERSSKPMSGGMIYYGDPRMQSLWGVSGFWVDGGMAYRLGGWTYTWGDDPIVDRRFVVEYFVDALPDAGWLTVSLPIRLEIKTEQSVSIDGSVCQPQNGVIRTYVPAGIHELAANGRSEAGPLAQTLFSKWSDGETSNPRRLAVAEDLVLSVVYKNDYTRAYAVFGVALAALALAVLSLRKRKASLSVLSSEIGSASHKQTRVVDEKKSVTGRVKEVKQKGAPARFCRYCGAGIQKDSVFCEVCGQRLQNR